MEAAGSYLVRRAGGHYHLREITADRALVATRAICASPLSRDLDAVFFAGYDANKAPAHNTAWIYQSSAATATDAEPR